MDTYIEILDISPVNNRKGVFPLYCSIVVTTDIYMIKYREKDDNTALFGFFTPDNDGSIIFGQATIDTKGCINGDEIGFYKQFPTHTTSWQILDMIKEVAENIVYEMDELKESVENRIFAFNEFKKQCLSAIEFLGFSDDDIYKKIVECDTLTNIIHL